MRVLDADVTQTAFTIAFFPATIKTYNLIVIPLTSAVVSFKYREKILFSNLFPGS